MNTPPREFACAIIIDTLGHFLCQKRDDVAGILHPGKTGLFGGHREEDETFLQCVVREIHEEISYFVSPDRFDHLLTYSGPDMDIEDGRAHGEFFVARDVPADALLVTEGSLRIVEPNELSVIWSEFTSTAQFAIKAFLDTRCCSNQVIAAFKSE
jgi:8-oxo-dGTP diphosphatase